MAAPASVDLRSLSGKWIMNKSLSDSADPLLRLQGMNIITRKTLRMSVMSLVMQQTSEDPVSINTVNKASGLSVSEESLTLDGKPYENHDDVFGDVSISARWIPVPEIKDELLDTGLWDESTIETGAIEETWVNDKAGWTSRGIWGFEVINGKRHHVRRYRVTKGKEMKSAKVVYDHSVPK